MSATTLYLDEHSPPHRWHPLTKLAIAGLGFVVAAAVPRPLQVLAFFLFIQIPLAASARFLSAFLKSIALIIWPFALSLAIIQGFFTPGETPLFALGPYTFTQEGLLAGMEVALRIMVALSATILLMMSTRPDRLMQALREKGLPDAIGYIVLTALQIFPRFQDRARVILDAQQARGLELQVGLLRRLRLLVPMIGPLILSSIVDVEERAMALEARAFNHPGRKTQLVQLSDSTLQRLFRFLLLLTMLALILMRLLPLLP